MNNQNSFKISRNYLVLVIFFLWASFNVQAKPILSHGSVYSSNTVLHFLKTERNKRLTLRHTQSYAVCFCWIRISLLGLEYVECWHKTKAVVNTAANLTDSVRSLWLAFPLHTHILKWLLIIQIENWINPPNNK